MSPSSLLRVAVVLVFQGTSCCLPVTDSIIPGLAHVLFHDVVGRTLRGEEQDAEEVPVHALPRCHGRRILCGCRLCIALENGGDALPVERQDDAKPVLEFQKLGLIFAVKTWTEIQHCCCCYFSHSAHWLPTRKKLLYTVANPARGLLNREKKKKKSLAAHPPPPPPARCSFGEKIKIIK